MIVYYNKMESYYIEEVKKDVYEILDSAWEDEKEDYEDNMDEFRTWAYDNNLFNYELSYNNANWFDILIYIYQYHKELTGESITIDNLDKFYKIHRYFLGALLDKWYEDRVLIYDNEPPT